MPWTGSPECQDRPTDDGELTIHREISQNFVGDYRSKIASWSKLMAMSTTKSVAVHNQPLNCQTGICTNIAQQRKIFNPNIAIWNLEILSVDGSWQTKVQRSPLQITVLSYQTPVGTYWPHQAGDASDKQTKEPQFHKYKHKYTNTNTNTQIHPVAATGHIKCLS